MPRLPLRKMHGRPSEGRTSGSEKLWRNAMAYPEIASDYRTTHAGSIKEPVPTSDDATESTKHRSRTRFRGDDLLKLRSAQRLWIEAGNVTQNRGRGVPGNQIMMRAMTRVFFGVEARDVARDTHLRTLAISFQGHISWDRTLRYSNNSMDVLTVTRPRFTYGSALIRQSNASAPQVVTKWCIDL